jgi:helicase
MITETAQKYLDQIGISELRPAQKKAIEAGVLQQENVLVCTPTASGKTLVAELAMREIVSQHKKAVYVVPLKALGSEKFRSFRERMKNTKIALSISDFDKNDSSLAEADIIIATAEKLDSLLRHHAPWLGRVGIVVVDEIHLLNDSSRGPTLEILLTMLRRLVKPQILGLSATIGNPQELADWLDATLVEDNWRPVRLDKGVYVDSEVRFEEE